VEFNAVEFYSNQGTGPLFMSSTESILGSALISNSVFDGGEDIIVAEEIEQMKILQYGF